MPTADKFTALGAGNGFSSCLTKQNVLERRSDQGEYYQWTTLSGFNKDSGGMPTEQQITDSFVLAMKLFWNIYEIRGSAAASETYPDPNGWSVSAQLTNASTTDEPNTLACEQRNNFYDQDSDDSGDPYYYSVEVSIGCNIGPIRMYKGDTTDEDNFIGYGVVPQVAPEDRPISSWAGSYDNAQVFVSLDSFQFQDVSTIDYFDSAYVEVSGMHFVCFVGTYTFDVIKPVAEDMSVSISGSDFAYSASITSIDFYTY